MDYSESNNDFKVNKLLSEATCKEDVLDILEFIDDELSGGTFMQ